jgi:chemotaxis protein MotB
MAEKKKAQEEEHGESAPLWIISFADLVTLMLSFFVILAAGNNGGASTKNDPEFAKIVSALRMAFRDSSPADEAVLAAAADYEDLVNKLHAMAKKPRQTNVGDSNEPGLYGTSFRVRKIRDGMEITMGGSVFFEPLSGTLTEQGMTDVRELAELLKGHRNNLEVRGHAADEPRPSDWTFKDLLELSHQRADTVAEELIKLGVDPRTIRVVAIGPNEPIARGAQGASNLAMNRRVEVIVRESLIDDYMGQSPATNH